MLLFPKGYAIQIFRNGLSEGVWTPMSLLRAFDQPSITLLYIQIAHKHKAQQLLSTKIFDFESAALKFPSLKIEESSDIAGEAHLDPL